MNNNNITFIKAIFGGLCIAFGAFASCGLPKPLNGIIFSSGLIMIILMQLKLFTGDILSAKDGITKEVIKNWIIIYIGNFIGCFLFAQCILLSDYDLTKLSIIGIDKANLDFVPCLIRAIFCNVLVCTAVFLSRLTNDILTKIFSIMIPVTIFVISGFEHSVANMFYYTIPGVSYFNLIPATIGNIIGGFLVILIMKLHIQK